jgi:hypothetical protein
MKYFISVLMFLHGAIHLMGFTKAFDLAKVEQLNIPISKLSGLFWLLAFLLFFVAGIALLAKANWWYIVAIFAVILSSILIITCWGDAKFGTIANVIILIAALLALSGCSSLKSSYISKVENEFSHQPLISEDVLSESDIAHLPVPVQKYIIYSGAIGKPKPQNVYIEFDAKMVNKTGAKPMKSQSEQYNFYGSFSRHFLMKASMFFIPVRAHHVYTGQQATFVVRVASLFNAVDISGEELTKAETVTLLNDMCLFVPGNLADKRLSWKETDSLSAQVTLENGPYKVSAVLHFNPKGELVNFISDDRYALQDDGKLRKARWSTPVGDYKVIDGRKIATYGETTWNYPEGDFTYGRFRLKNIEYNVKKNHEDNR